MMITHIKDKKRFELETEQGTAFVSYHLDKDTLVLWHSEVPYALRGQGIGKQLVEGTFEFIREHKLNAIATCSYIRAIAQRDNQWHNVIKL